MLEDISKEDHLSSRPDRVIRLHGHQVGGVVLPDGDLAGGGAVPAANLQHGVGGLDDSPHRSMCPGLDCAGSLVKVLVEEVTQVVGQPRKPDSSGWEL